MTYFSHSKTLHMSSSKLFLLHFIPVSLLLFLGGGGGAMYSQSNTFPSNGNAGVGTPNPGEKLEVVGNLKVKGDLIVTDTAKFKGDVKIVGELKLKSLVDDTQSYDRLLGISPIGIVTAHSNLHFNTPNGVLDVNGTISSTGPMRSSRFTAPVGDSISVNSTRNFFYVNQLTVPISPNDFRGLGFGDGCFSRGINGIGIGFSSHGSGTNSIAIGDRVVAFASNSIVIGTSFSNSDRIVNTTSNSLMIGFNSDMPTLYVSPSSGAGTTGVVCIGSTVVPIGPQYKLAVAGTILAHEVEVVSPAQWPDYVLEPDYLLMSTGEREAYILKHKRLPWMKSAAELSKKGLAVGEMFSGITKNVEELTLYIIQQQKTIDNLEKRLAEIETAMKLSKH